MIPNISNDHSMIVNSKHTGSCRLSIVRERGIEGTLHTVKGLLAQPARSALGAETSEHADCGEDDDDGGSGGGDDD
jgi:hypothetical protein